MSMKILKNLSHQTATFVILEPEIEDRNGDIISADEIVNTAHHFMRHLPDKRVNLEQIGNNNKRSYQNGRIFYYCYLISSLQKK